MHARGYWEFLQVGGNCFMGHVTIKQYDVKKQEEYILEKDIEKILKLLNKLKNILEII